MATDPTTPDLRQAVMAATTEYAEITPFRGRSPDREAVRCADIILRHLSPAFERVQAQAAGMREKLMCIGLIASGHHEQQPMHVLLHALTVDIPRACEAALAPDAGSALLARAAAAEGLAIAAEGYYLTTDHDGVMTDTLREAIAAYRQLCPAGAEVK